MSNQSLKEDTNKKLASHQEAMISNVFDVEINKITQFLPKSIFYKYFVI